MEEKKESPQERALNASLTSPAENTGQKKADLKEPDAFGPVNIQEDLRPNPPEDRGARPEMAKHDDPLPAPGQTSKTIDDRNR